MDPEPFPNADSTFVGDIWSFLRYYAWPLVILFFSPTFHNHDEEQKYRREAWDASKVCVSARKYTALLCTCLKRLPQTLALACSSFFILNWILGCAIHSKPFMTVDQVLYYGVRSGPVPLFGSLIRATNLAYI